MANNLQNRHWFLRRRSSKARRDAQRIRKWRSTRGSQSRWCKGGCVVPTKGRLGGLGRGFESESSLYGRTGSGRCKGYLPPFPSLHSRAERTRMPTTLPWVGVLECLEIYRWEPLAIT